MSALRPLTAVKLPMGKGRKRPEADLRLSETIEAKLSHYMQEIGYELGGLVSIE